MIANRKANSMTWRAEIRTPGQAEDTRRLGELRLESLIGLSAGLVSNNSTLAKVVMTVATLGGPRCDSSINNYLLFAERSLFSVTLRSGARREVLPFKRLYARGFARNADSLAHCDCQVLLAKTCFARLADHDWPDDTVLEFEYMDELPTTAAASPQR